MTRTGSNGRDARATTEIAARRVMKETHGRGVDVAIEAAWAEESVTQAAQMLRLGGRLVVVGISGGNRWSYQPPSPGAKDSRSS